MVRSSVVLPAPFEPTTQTISPARHVEVDAPEHLHVAVARLQARHRHAAARSWRRLRQRRGVTLAEIGLGHARDRASPPPADRRRSAGRDAAPRCGSRSTAPPSSGARSRRWSRLRAAIERMSASASSISLALRPALTSSRKQQLRLHGEALGQLEPLAAARASACRPAGRRYRRARPGGQARAPAPWPRASERAPPANMRAGGDILAHGHVRERLHDLEGAADAAARDPVWTAGA